VFYQRSAGEGKSKSVYRIKHELVDSINERFIGLRHSKRRLSALPCFVEATQSWSHTRERNLPWKAVAWSFLAKMELWGRGGCSISFSPRQFCFPHQPRAFNRIALIICFIHAKWKKLNFPPCIYQYHRDDRYNSFFFSVFGSHITFCILSLIIGVTFLTPVHAREARPALESCRFWQEKITAVVVCNRVISQPKRCVVRDNDSKKRSYLASLIFLRRLFLLRAHKYIIYVSSFLPSKVR